MKTDLKLPCDGCILLPVCKQRFNEHSKEFTHIYYGIKKLSENCKIIDNFVTKIGLIKTAHIIRGIF